MGEEKKIFSFLFNLVNIIFSGSFLANSNKTGEIVLTLFQLLVEVLLLFLICLFVLRDFDEWVMRKT